MNCPTLVFFIAHLIIASCQQVNNGSPTSNPPSLAKVNSTTLVSEFHLFNLSKELITSEEDSISEEEASTPILLEEPKTTTEKVEILKTKVKLSVGWSNDTDDSFLNDTIAVHQEKQTSVDSPTTPKTILSTVKNIPLEFQTTTTTTKQAALLLAEEARAVSVAPQNLEISPDPKNSSNFNSSEGSLTATNETMARLEENVSPSPQTSSEVTEARVVTIFFPTTLAPESDGTTNKEALIDTTTQPLSTEIASEEPTSSSKVETTTQESPSTTILPNVSIPTQEPSPTFLPFQSTTVETTQVSITTVALPTTEEEEALVKEEAYMLVLKANCPKEINDVGDAISHDPSVQVSNCSSSFKMNLRVNKNATISTLDSFAASNKRVEITIGDRQYEVVHVEKYIEIDDEKPEPFNFQSKEFILFVALGSVLGAVVLVAICLLCCRCFRCCCKKKSKSAEDNFTLSGRMSLNMDEYSESRIPRPMTYCSNDRHQVSTIRNSFAPPFAEVREEGMVQSFDTSVVPLEDGRILDDMITLREGRGGTMRTFNAKRDSWMNNNVDDHANSTDRLHLHSESLNRGFGNPTYGRISTPIV